jgi:hypothetical protein
MNWNEYNEGYDQSTRYKSVYIKFNPARQINY